MFGVGARRKLIFSGIPIRRWSVLTGLIWIIATSCDRGDSRYALSTHPSLKARVEGHVPVTDQELVGWFDKTCSGIRHDSLEQKNIDLPAVIRDRGICGISVFQKTVLTQDQAKEVLMTLQKSPSNTDFLAWLDEDRITRLSRELADRARLAHGL